KLFAYFGDQGQANAYSYQADNIAEAVTRLCWNADREIFSDTPKGKSFSQHANILALLTDLAPAAAPHIMLSGSEGVPTYQQALLNKVLSDKSLTQVSEYFRFYLIQALYHTGRADLYVDQLKVWAAYLDQGFTTFPEKPGETRSDCHAWSASPNYDLLATLVGIRPASPGFKTVSIRPAYTNFAYSATAAHPGGVIIVKASAGGKDVFYDITLPEGVTGELIVDTNRHLLHSGLNSVTVGME
ncbi:MAG: alpha-L-rhamnosidase C-terminal domain-containing protein, partial [Lewinella sp.]